MKAKLPRWLLVSALAACIAVGAGLIVSARSIHRFLLTNTVIGPSYEVLWHKIRATYHVRLRDPAVIRHYLRHHGVRKLQIGSGANILPGWLNSEYAPGKAHIYLDATERFPLPDASLDFIFSEHVIEHLPYEGGLNMLRETHRTLRKGGKTRIVTPDLQKFIDAVVNPHSEWAIQFIRIKLSLERWPAVPHAGVYILNRQARDWGHQFLYDAPTLQSALETAGFSGIRIYRPSETDEPAFKGVETRNEGLRGVLNSLAAMALEGVKQ